MTAQRFLVPYGKGHLSAMAVLPEGEPAGLVVFLLYNAAPDLVGGNLWAWASRRLAERGFASLRLDYEGFGDSTGEFELLRMEDFIPQHAGQARATLAALRGGEPLPFAAVGACHDARVALELARDRDCVCAICLDMPVTFRLPALSALRRVKIEARQARVRLRTRRALRAAGRHTRLVLLQDGRRMDVKGHKGAIGAAVEIDTRVPFLERDRLSRDDEELLDTVVDELVSAF